MFFLGGTFQNWQEVLASQLLAEVEVRDTPGLRRHTLICLYVCIYIYIYNYMYIYIWVRVARSWPPTPMVWSPPIPRSTSSNSSSTSTSTT